MSDLCLRNGAAELELAPELGGRVRRWRFRDEDLIKPITSPSFDLDHWPPAGAFPLIPFGLRIKNGLFVFQNSSVQLSIPKGATHALHGISSRSAWSTVRRSENSVRLELRHKANGVWPWDFEAVQEFTLLENGLTVELALRNSSDKSMPGGIGWHPSFPKVASISAEHPVHWEFDAEQLPARPVKAKNDVCDGRLLYLEDVKSTTITLQSGTKILCKADNGLPHAVVFDQDPSRTCWEPISCLPSKEFGVALATVPAQSEITGKILLTLTPK